MDAIIRARLNEIEQNEHVRIILAVEAGSRAWGFSSPDSDYDVRFIYVKNQKEYLRLEEIRDSIDWQQDEHLDIEGWDLRKVLRMIYRSTPDVHEWFSSPIVYREMPEMQELRRLMAEYFSVKKCTQNYYHIASMNYRTYFRDEEVWLVKYFYLLRPMLLAKWLLEEDSLPPMQLEDLVKAKMAEEWKEYILGLLNKKKISSELGKAHRNKRLNEYVSQQLEEIERRATQLDKEEKKSWDQLNQYFLYVLQIKKEGAVR